MSKKSDAEYKDILAAGKKIREIMPLADRQAYVLNLKVNHPGQGKTFYQLVEALLIFNEAPFSFEHPATA